MSGGQLSDNESVSSCSNSAPIAYRMGFEYGLHKFCTFEQGLFEGEHGDQPSLSCREPKWEQYQEGFLTGRQIFGANQRLELINTELQLTRKHLLDVPSKGGTDALAAVDHERITMLRGEIARLVTERDFETRRLTSLKNSLKLASRNSLSSLQVVSRQ